jgi:hypothetical protein
LVLITRNTGRKYSPDHSRGFGFVNGLHHPTSPG